MPQLLLILGAILALVGLGSIAAGAPDWLLGLSLGATLIQSGTIAFVGGLVIVGLGLVLYALQDLLRRLDGVGQGAAPARPAAMLPPADQPAPSARQAASPSTGARQPPQSDTPRARERELGSAAAEAPSSREGVGGDQPRARRERREPAPEFAAEDRFAERPPGAEPRQRRERPRDAHPDDAPRVREARTEEVAQPRRPAPAPLDEDEAPPARRPASAVFGEDEASRPRQRQRSEPAHDEIPRVRPERTDRPREQPEEAPARQPRREFAPIPAIPQPFGGEGRRAPEPGRDNAEPKFRPAESAPQRPGSDTVVRSGVIGGMAYTLYVDGSIEAELPIGTVRFNSIAELQDHVLRTGAEADGDFDDQQR